MNATPEQVKNAVEHVWAKKLFEECTRPSLFQIERKPLGRCGRMRLRILRVGERVRDAWLVLTGKASIGEDW
jgi:hypothetical protein